MELTKQERETIIVFNEEESTAEVDTCNKALIKQLDSLSEKMPNVVVIGEDEHGKRYRLPKKWVKIRNPRQYSEEERAKMAERAKERFGVKTTS